MQTLEKPLEQKSVIIAPPASASTMTVASVVGEIVRNLFLFPLLCLYTRPVVRRRAVISGAGPYLFAVNHCSHLDTPLLLAALPRSLRLRLRVAAAADYFFDRPWKAALMRVVLNAFPFVRKGPHCSDSLELAQQLL
ncbi:MAG: 1-acyl-sn-glycerol-3-phosphate acyltransferase, partial [Ktedonobacteraceae bacterium]|nr:1-acyl-sn-glycerol-3-phosphate acyltransferase [Ktedonobacteraceae bacterium]